jgi:hypothetical protein
MSQKEGETDYKYEDYASEMATYCDPQTDVFVNHSRSRLTPDPHSTSILSRRIK